MRFWITGLAAIVMVGAAVLMFSANSSSTVAQNEEPDRVVLHRGNSAEASTLDPHKMTGTWESRIVGDMFVGLTTLTADGSVIWGAAEAHEVSEDGLTHTFTMREGAVWSDGTPVTAYDFEYSWRRFVDPNTAAEFASLFDMILNATDITYGRIDDVTQLGAHAIDERTFVVTLNHPEPFMPEIVAQYYTYPVPPHVVEEHGDAWARPGNIVTNGPYVASEWVPNDHITVVKNELFYDAENVAIDEVVFYPTDEEATALRRFRAGELDLNTGFPSQQNDWLLENMPNERRVAHFYNTNYTIFNMELEKFQDVRIRQAMALAIDRDVNATNVLALGQTPAYTLVPPYVPDYPLPVPEYAGWTQEQRWERARELMEEAGYGPDNPLEFIYRYRERIDNRRVAIAVADAWSNIYVNVSLVNTETAVHYADLRAGNFEVADAGWVVSYPDPGQFLLLTNSDYGELNTSGYDNPEFVALYRQAMLTPDRAARGALLAQAEQIMLADAPLIPNFFGVSSNLVGPHVIGWEDNPGDVHRTRWLSIDESLKPSQESFVDQIMRWFN